MCLVTSQGIERPQALFVFLVKRYLLLVNNLDKNRLFQEFRVPRHETSGRICQSNVKHRVRCCIVLVNAFEVGQMFFQINPFSIAIATRIRGLVDKLFQFCDHVSEISWGHVIVQPNPL